MAQGKTYNKSPRKINHKAPKSKTSKTYQAPSEKNAFSKKKDFAPKGSKFFPFREDLFLEESKYYFDLVTSLESVYITFKTNWFHFVIRLFISLLTLFTFR